MTRSMKTIRPRHAAASISSSSSNEATRTTSASRPPAGVATLPPSAVRASFCETGEVTSPTSMPLCQTGTVTGSARTFGEPLRLQDRQPGLDRHGVSRRSGQARTGPVDDLAHPVEGARPGGDRGRAGRRRSGGFRARAGRARPSRSGPSRRARGSRAEPGAARSWFWLRKSRGMVSGTPSAAASDPNRGPAKALKSPSHVHPHAAPRGRRRRARRRVRGQRDLRRGPAQPLSRQPHLRRRRVAAVFPGAVRRDRGAAARGRRRAPCRGTGARAPDRRGATGDPGRRRPDRGEHGAQPRGSRRRRRSARSPSSCSTRTAGSSTRNARRRSCPRSPSRTCSPGR